MEFEHYKTSSLIKMVTSIASIHSTACFDHSLVRDILLTLTIQAFLLSICQYQAIHLRPCERCYPTPQSCRPLLWLCCACWKAACTCRVRNVPSNKRCFRELWPKLFHITTVSKFYWTVLSKSCYSVGVSLIYILPYKCDERLADFIFCERWIYEIIVRDLWPEGFAWRVKN